MSKTVLVKVPEMPVKLHTEIKVRALREGLKIGDYIVKVLEGHIKKGGG